MFVQIWLHIEKSKHMYNQKRGGNNFPNLGKLLLRQFLYVEPSMTIIRTRVHVRVRVRVRVRRVIPARQLGLGLCHIFSDRYTAISIYAIVKLKIIK